MAGLLDTNVWITVTGDGKDVIAKLQKNEPGKGKRFHHVPNQPNNVYQTSLYHLMVYFNMGPRPHFDAEQAHADSHIIDVKFVDQGDQ